MDAHDIITMIPQMSVYPTLVQYISLKCSTHGMGPSKKGLRHCHRRRYLCIDGRVEIVSRSIIGVSQSEPHINHAYEKIACTYVCVYVCMYAVIRCSHVLHASALYYAIHMVKIVSVDRVLVLNKTPTTTRKGCLRLKYMKQI